MFRVQPDVPSLLVVVAEDVVATGVRSPVLSEVSVRATVEVAVRREADEELGLDVHMMASLDDVVVAVVVELSVVEL